MERMMKCVGDTCRMVRDTLPEIAGGLVGASGKLAALDLPGAIGEVSEGASQNTLLVEDLDDLKSILRNLKSNIRRIQARKYQPCSLHTLKSIVSRIQKRIHGYSDPSKKGRTYRAAWSQYYRTQLLNDILMIQTSIITSLLEIQQTQVLLQQIHAENNSRKKKKLLETLSHRCDGASSFSPPLKNVVA